MILQQPEYILQPAKRIVSLVPSQTELLHSFGLNTQTVGITRFCIHPASWHQSKTRVGGTKTVDIPKLMSLHPDLVIANKEENVRGQIELLGQVAPVWVTDVNNLDDAYKMILDVGVLTGRQHKASQLIAAIDSQFSQLELRRVVRAAYLIWKDPYMVAATNTFIHDMLHHAGFINVFADMQRYPAVTLAQLADAQPDVVLFSSEPYPFKEQHFPEIQAVLPDAQMMVVDGEMFSWYGSRLLHAPQYFEKLQQRID